MISSWPFTSGVLNGEVTDSDFPLQIERQGKLRIASGVDSLDEELPLVQDVQCRSRATIWLRHMYLLPHIHYYSPLQT